MGLLRYVRITFLRDFKSSFFYMFAMVLSIALVFNTFNVISNPNIVAIKGPDYTTMTILGLTVQAIAALLMFFSNSYYIEERLAEYGVIVLVGKSVYEVCGILLLRSLFINTIAIFLGCILGAITSPLVTGEMYSILKFEGDSTYLSMTGLVATVLILYVQFTFVLLFNTGSVYRKAILELVHHKNTPFISDKRAIKFNSKIYFIMFLLPIAISILPISAKDKTVLLSFAIILASYGTYGIVRYVIPDLLYNFKTRSLTTDKIKIISISNLYHSIQKSTLLILTLIITTGLCISIACTYKEGSVFNIISLTCFLVVVGVMSLTIVYKFMVESFSRKENYIQLKLLGYTKTEILRIIIEEVVLYYGLILSIALAHLLPIVITSISAGLLTSTLGVKLIVSFILTFVVTGFISFFGYKKVAL